MSGFYLAPHVRSCELSDGVVLLDLLHDEYLSLDPADARSLARIVSGSGASMPPADLEILGSLLSRELICTAPTDKARTAIELEPAARCLVHWEDIAGTPVRLRQVAAATTAALRAIVSLRCLSLYHIVKTIEKLKQRRFEGASPGTAAAPTSLRSLLAAYFHIGPFLHGAAGRCLADSLELMYYLAFFSHFPTWVIGVRTKPFAAHSWVQHGDTVLNDTPENVLSFTPILTV